MPDIDDYSESALRRSGKCITKYRRTEYDGYIQIYYQEKDRLEAAIIGGVSGGAAGLGAAAFFVPGVGPAIALGTTGVAVGAAIGASIGTHYDYYRYFDSTTGEYLSKNKDTAKRKIAKKREREHRDAERQRQERACRDAERQRQERAYRDARRQEMYAEYLERERIKAERHERLQRELEFLYAEQERQRLFQIEAHRAAERRERIEAERRERERVEAERRKRECIEAERRERERIDALRRERERKEAERRERERIEAEKRERERIDAERRERERIDALRRERERKDAERREKERQSSQCNSYYKGAEVAWEEGWKAESIGLSNEAETKFEQALELYKSAFSLLRKDLNLCSDVQSTVCSEKIQTCEKKIKGNKLFNEGVELHEKADRLKEEKHYTEALSLYHQAGVKFREGFDKSQDARFEKCIKLVNACILEVNETHEALKQQNFATSLTQLNINKNDQQQDIGKHHQDLEHVSMLLENINVK